MSTNLDQVKERIRRLLAVAENDASTNGEIDNALRFASQLMAVHNLSRDDVLAMNGMERRERIRFGQHATFTVGARMSFWESSLMQFCTSLVGTCSSYYSYGHVRRKDGRAVFGRSGEPLKATRVTFYGPDEDAEFCAAMFEEISVAIAAMSRLRWGTVFRGDGGSYCEGFVEGLQKASDRQKEQLKRSDQTTSALIVRSDQTATVIRRDAENWLRDDQGIRLRSGGGRSGVEAGFNEEAFSEGVRDGKQYNVNGKQPTRKLV